MHAKTALNGHATTEPFREAKSLRDMSDEGEERSCVYVLGLIEAAPSATVISRFRGGGHVSFYQA
jgi:hypothetical protein